MTHCYKLGGYNIAIDVASGSIHSVDEAAYDVISIYKSAPKEGIGAFLKGKYRRLNDGDVEGLFAEIDELISQGKLFTVDEFDKTAARCEKPPLKALCLNVSHCCNMVCYYCFAGRGGYGDSGGLMSVETGKRAIDFLIGNSGGIKNLDVDFFGGEPLLNWGAVKEIVKYARKIERETDKVFRFTLTTNGLLIDDDVIGFTNAEMSNVVLSLDGRPETNDAYRKLPGGTKERSYASSKERRPASAWAPTQALTGSYNAVAPKIRKLVEARGEREYYIRGTFTRDNPDFTLDILHMADLGFTKLSIEPVVAAPGSDYGLAMDDLPWINRQYETLAEEMRRRRTEGKGFTFYHFMLDLTGGPCIHKRIAGCGAGAGYMAVTPGGELYPCHQFVGNKRFLLGDVWRGVVNRGLRGEFINLGLHSRGECGDCWARYYCSGGCAANAYMWSGDIRGLYPPGCEMFKKRIECAIMLKISELSPVYPPLWPGTSPGSGGGAP